MCTFITLYVFFLIIGLLYVELGIARDSNVREAYVVLLRFAALLPFLNLGVIVLMLLDAIDDHKENGEDRK